MSGEVTAYIGVGSNLGDRRENMRRAVRLLAEMGEITVKRVAPLYRTAPLGVEDQPEFFNSVVEVRTALPPRELLARLLKTEASLGRVREKRWGPRLIDLDLLLYDDLQLATPELTLPHPRLTERAFVVVPLSQLVPEMLLPGGFKAVELAGRLQKHQRVEKVAEEWLTPDFR